MPGEELLTMRTKPGGPPRWLVPIFEMCEVDMKKRSDFEIRVRAEGERVGVVEIRMGLGIEGMICFLLRYLGQFPKCG